MSIPDEILCEMPLPDDAPDFVKRCPVFQTKDTGGDGTEYRITKDREFQVMRTFMGCALLQAFGVPEEKWDEVPPTPVVWKRKRIEMFVSNIRAAGPRGKEYVYYTDNGEDYIDITYVVQIRNGRVSSIKELHRDVKQARPYSEFNT